MAPHDQPLKPQPVEKFTCSSITANIWKNEGEKGAFYNVTITRSYKTADGWKRSDSFRLNDLEAVTVSSATPKCGLQSRPGNNRSSDAFGPRAGGVPSPYERRSVMNIYRDFATDLRSASSRSHRGPHHR